MEQMRQNVHTKKSICVLGSAESHVLELSHREINEHSTSFSFVSTGAYLPLVVCSGGRKKKAGWISGAFKTASRNEVLIFLHAMYLIKKVQMKEKLIVTLY